MATVMAFVFRFNKIAIYAGTFIKQPVFTLVPIIIVSYAVGAFFLGPAAFNSGRRRWVIQEPGAFFARLLSHVFSSKLVYR